MKKIVLFLLLFSIAHLLKAQIFVSRNEAIEICLSYLEKSGTICNRSSFRIDSTIKSQNNDILLYFVSNDDGIRYVVPGTKCLPGILAIIGDNQKDTIPFGINFWIEYYTRAVNNSILIKSNDIHRDWTQNSSKSQQSNEIIGPLLTSSWKQKSANRGSDNHAYNYFVNEICNECNDYAPVGCVAVAMGQVMNYWKYPFMRFDKSSEHFYDWCNMSDSLNVSSNNYMAEKIAISRLLYDCGIAADMNYCFMNKCQSFAWPYKAKNALINEFGYSNNMDIIRRTFYTDEQWKEMFVEELKEYRPIIYAVMEDSNTTSIIPDIIPENGHAFVCDGYDPNADLFHFNLGYGGSNNNWFCINNFNIQNYDVIEWQRAIIKIFPSDNSLNDFCNSTLELYEYFHEYYIENGNITPDPYQNVPQVSSDLVSAYSNESIPSSWRTIPIGQSSEYIAHKSITLKPGFHAERGSNFIAKIVQCTNCEDNANRLMATTTTKGTTTHTIDSTFITKTIVNFNNQNLLKNELLFPNPSHDIITFSGNDIADVAIFDPSGKSVFRWYIVSKNDNEVVINIQALPQGAYILAIKHNNGSFSTMKFIKNNIK